jgi:hypothetical protein
MENAAWEFSIKNFYWLEKSEKILKNIEKIPTGLETTNNGQLTQ